MEIVAVSSPRASIQLESISRIYAPCSPALSTSCVIKSFLSLPQTPSAPVISHYIPGLASAAAAAASPHGSSSSRQQQLFSDSQHDAVDRTLLPTISSAQTGSGTGIGNTATGGRALSDRNKSAAAAAAAGDVEDNDEDQGSPKIIAFLFITAIILVYVMYLRLPTLPPDEAAKIVLPRSIAQVRDLAQVLLKYRDEHFSLVLGFFAAVYIFLQTFAIPGAIFLSILAGPLFGLPLGLLIVSLVATTGASMCYTLSKTLGAGIVRRKFPTQIASFRERIQSHQDNLFFYLLFLRISPLLPNWFISISSPILKIPLRTFAAATFIGLMPGNYLHITTGMSLNSLTSVCACSTHMVCERSIGSCLCLYASVMQSS